MSWLYYSLKSHAEWGTRHAIDPLIRPQITGLNLLTDFLAYDLSEARCMLHDYYVRKVVVSTEEDFIDISVSYDPEGTEEDILTFHLTGDIEIDAKLDTDGLPFIYEAQIGQWTGGRLQIAIQGYGLRARAERMEISLVPAD